jgi:hypothetical protein
MQHILGNLGEQDYESLFESSEFLLVQKGLGEASLNILCRYCDWFVRDVDLRATVSNNLLIKLKAVRSPGDVLSLVPEVMAGVKKHFFGKNTLSIDDE